MSLVGTESQVIGPSTTALLGHKQGTYREVEQPGHEPRPKWDPGTRK